MYLFDYGFCDIVHQVILNNLTDGLCKHVINLTTSPDLIQAQKLFISCTLT